MERKTGRSWPRETDADRDLFANAYLDIVLASKDTTASSTAASGDSSPISDPDLIERIAPYLGQPPPQDADTNAEADLPNRPGREVSDSLLVDGEKTWELRTRPTKIRGPVGIAAKGTGTIIGAVDLIDVHGPYTRPEIAPYEHLHRVPASSTSTYGDATGLYGWEVSGAVRFDPPIPYRHPHGAVIWVRLDPAVEVR